jgi:Pyruvate/2-oxoacid:ferredoxin oxidoreductase gamma subunit
LELKDRRVATVDATRIALELNLCVTGLPVVSTSILGAFSGATGEVGLTNVLKAIKEAWPGSAGEKNAKAAELAYERLLRGW